MELRHLRDFVAVAEDQSFTRAAAKLHVTQPALTRQIKNLEEEIQARLFDRVKGHVSLTEEGKSFLINARRALALIAESVQELQRSGRSESGQLNIGYVANTHCHLLPASLAEYRRVHPQVALNLFDMTCAAQLDALKTGHIDLGFVGMRESLMSTGLQGECIARYEVLVALARKNPLSTKSSVRLKELENLFFAGLSEDAYPGSREWIRRICSQEGFAPRILEELNGQPAVLRFVADALGVALLPEQITVLPHRGVVFRPLKPRVTIESCIAWRPDNSSTLLARYIEIVKKMVIKPTS